MTYDWRADALASWHFWCRTMALAIGARRFETLPEMYFQESRGAIP